MKSWWSMKSKTIVSARSPAIIAGVIKPRDVTWNATFQK
jgi:hypothetical protein